MNKTIIFDIYKYFQNNTMISYNHDLKLLRQLIDVSKKLMMYYFGQLKNEIYLFRENKKVKTTLKYECPVKPSIYINPLAFANIELKFCNSVGDIHEELVKFYNCANTNILHYQCCRRHYLELKQTRGIFIVYKQKIKTEKNKYVYMLTIKNGI